MNKGRNADYDERYIYIRKIKKKKKWPCFDGRRVDYSSILTLLTVQVWIRLLHK